MNNRWISLQLSGIKSSGAGWRACSAARVTARKACASMARVTQHDQEVKRRTWCSSSPARPLLDWKVSSTRHLDPATRTRVARGSGAVEKQPVVGPFAGDAVAADQQLLVIRSGVGQVDDRPVIEAVPLGAAPGRQLLPGPLGHLRGQRFGPELACASGDFG